MTAAQDSPTFAQGSGHDSCGLADAKETLRDHSLRRSLSLQLAEYCNHFLAEPLAVERRVETQQMPIEAEAEHQTSRTAIRRFAKRVRCFIRPTSSCRFRRPRAVRRYAWRPREVSCSLNRSIHSSSRSRRSAP